MYLTDDTVVLVATDRVSAFDYILPNHIPFKGQVLNRIARAAFEGSKDVVPNALLGDDVDPSVVVQRRLKNVGVECVVRGYLWGSLAAAHEKGARAFCGLDLPEGLHRFGKLPAPLFTPTTKADLGAHDENMTMAEVAALLGPDLADKIRELSLKLYQRGAELAAQRGLLFLDTKYEFGTDDAGNVLVIDEINTPDSSRLCDAAEWAAKFPLIEAEMRTGAYRDVSDLIAKKPDLKVTELSKQYVRDVLLEQGFQPGGTVPVLTEDQVVESAYRYIVVCERLTGEPFPFPAAPLPVAQRLVANLQRRGLIVGGLAVVVAGGNTAHAERVAAELKQCGIPVRPVASCDAALVTEYNDAIEPLLLINCGDDAASAGALRGSLFPVVACPPDGAPRHPDPNAACVVTPEGVARLALQILGLSVPKLREHLKRKVLG